MHVDARTMVAAAAGGDWAEARRAFTQAVPFPRVISRCCDAPCQTACVREQAGGGIRINELERAAMACPRRRRRRRCRPGSKPGRVAVVGAGLSGLTAAYELARKGYAVVVFEAQDRAGGRARELGEDVLSEADLEADVATVTSRRAVRAVHHGSARAPRGANALSALAPDVDAVYLAMGAAEADAGAALGYLLDAQGRIASTRSRWRPAWAPTAAAASCGLEPWSPISSIADGRRAALSIDRELQHVSLGVAGRSWRLRDRPDRQHGRRRKRAAGDPRRSRPRLLARRSDSRGGALPAV